MSDISRVALFGKLNSLAYKAIDGAIVFCKLRGAPYGRCWAAEGGGTGADDYHEHLQRPAVE
jgi:type VI secretion system protein VasG